LILAALGEELVYRLAVLILVGAGTAKLLGRNWRNAEDWGVGPGLVALLAAGLVFTLLPGHVAQMSDTLHALPFACLGVVLGYAVLRTGALFPATVVHALLNLATIAAIAGTMSPEPRTRRARAGHVGGRHAPRHPAQSCARSRQGTGDGLGVGIGDAPTADIGTRR